jgi:tetratricopeptide (TPR) repeat protein
MAEAKEAGIEAMSTGDYQTAVDQFDRALQLSGGRVNAQVVDICFYKAAAQFNLGETAEAIDTYTAILTYDDSDGSVAFLRGSVYLQEGETDLAMEDYQLALQCSRDDGEMYLRIGENLAASGYTQEARSILEQGLDVTGESGADLMTKGRLYLALGEADQAAALLEQAVEKGTSQANLYLAQAYKTLGRNEEANTLLQDYAKAEDPDSELLAMLGDMEMEEGDYASALEFYRQGLEKDSLTNEQELRRGEISALEYAGNFAEAEEKMQEYLQLYPEDAQALREQVFLQSR